MPIPSDNVLMKMITFNTLKLPIVAKISQGEHEWCHLRNAYPGLPLANGGLHV